MPDNGSEKTGGAVIVQIVLDTVNGQTQFSYNTDNMVLVLQMLHSAYLEAQYKYLQKRLQPEPSAIIVPKVIMPSDLKVESQ